jgi:hypothetical protein
MEILIALGALAGGYFFGMNVYLARKNSELVKELKLEAQTNYFTNDEDRENFIKFISDSREWAFDYIEEVQTGLSKFVSDVEPVINHFNNYGDVIWTPLTDSMKTISVSFEDLKKLLPEEKDA